MSERLSHPTATRLQAFLEESLESAERAVVESHLTRCDRCQTEVAELRSLFAALGGLPMLEPTPGFADRVMERVEVRRPVAVTVAAWTEEWLERITPQSTPGWAAAAAVLALPVIGATVLVAWLLSQPGVSAQGLWMIGTALVGEAAASSGQWVWTQLVDSTLALWAVELADFVGSVGRGQIGLAVVMFATLTAGSIYVLYQNLFRTQQPRRVEHASYVI